MPSGRQARGPGRMPSGPQLDDSSAAHPGEPGRRAGRRLERGRAEVSMSGTSVSELAAMAAASGAPAGQAEFVLLGMPDVHGSVRGKALRPHAFEAAIAD